MPPGGWFFSSQHFSMIKEHFERLPGLEGMRFIGGQADHLSFLDRRGRPGNGDFGLTLDDRAVITCMKMQKFMQVFENTAKNLNFYGINVFHPFNNRSTVGEIAGAFILVYANASCKYPIQPFSVASRG